MPQQPDLMTVGLSPGIQSRTRGVASKTPKAFWWQCPWMKAEAARDG